MMRAFAAGTFEATGSDLYICCGFVPDFVTLQNLTDTTNYEKVTWTINNRVANSIAGEIIKTLTDTDRALLSVRAGVTIYRGGDMISAASTSYVIPNPAPDRRGHGTGAFIDTWTKDSSTTGHFNAPVTTSGNYAVGVGSRFIVDGKWYMIQALTDDGDASGDITVAEDAAPSSGDVGFLSSKFDYVPISATELANGNITTPAGFRADATGFPMTDADVCYFEAGCYM